MFVSQRPASVTHPVDSVPIKNGQTLGCLLESYEQQIKSNTLATSSSSKSFSFYLNLLKKCAHAKENILRQTVTGSTKINLYLKDGERYFLVPEDLIDPSGRNGERLFLACREQLSNYEAISFDSLFEIPADLLFIASNYFYSAFNLYQYYTKNPGKLHENPYTRETLAANDIKKYNTFKPAIHRHLAEAFIQEHITNLHLAYCHVFITLHASSNTLLAVFFASLACEQAKKVEACVAKDYNALPHEAKAALNKMSGAENTPLPEIKSHFPITQKLYHHYTKSPHARNPCIVPKAEFRSSALDDPTTYSRAMLSETLRRFTLSFQLLSQGNILLFMQYLFLYTPSLFFENLAAKVRPTQQPHP